MNPDLIEVAKAAGYAIPPAWPLAATVAVNPYLGQTGNSLSHVSALMARVAGAPITMPADWYAAQIADGTITPADLTAAGATEGADALLAQAADQTPAALPTVADLAAAVSGIDWPGLIEDRMGTWAAGHFDEGQALWLATTERGTFESWQIFASRDLTPEIAGLTGFAAHVAALPDFATRTMNHCADALGVTPQIAPTYFHQLLLGLGGWSQLARYRLFQAELAGGTDAAIADLLAIRLAWDHALFTQYGAEIADKWQQTLAAHAAPLHPTAGQSALITLQKAAERAAQRALAETLAAPAATPFEGRPKLQAAFCIDVRSEVFRRALESVDPSIRTQGFAGFFGLTLSHHDFASDVAEHRMPVLLNAGLHSATTAAPSSDETARFAARASRAWGRFKLAAVSSFAFVEATGPLYGAKLVRDALGMTKTHEAAPAPTLTTDLPLADKIAAGVKILRAMSMTSNFAPLVLMVGHGANVTNNPHASALHCGACGGYSGEVNARLLAGLLNDGEVRQGIAAAGISIPEDTTFLGALHDTTTDAVTIYEDAPAAITQAKTWLAAAGALARTERAQRLPRAANGDAVSARASDWSETRPEWALAGCSAFIAAPRSRTRGKGLAGRAFLHDYDWHEDEGFGVLELILTAPVVVASWISLQYYGSTVSPEIFGGGNKLLHNITGGVGVVEGNGGRLRAGLPWQSVHDGDKLAHEPLRLSVCIEAPADAITAILAKHANVAELFDNGWLNLFALNENGQMTRRYAGGLTWEAVAAETAKAA